MWRADVKAAIDTGFGGVVGEPRVSGVAVAVENGAVEEGAVEEEADGEGAGGRVGESVDVHAPSMALTSATTTSRRANLTCSPYAGR